MKRILALLLCLVMCVSLVPAAFAGDIELVPVEDEDLIALVEPETSPEAVNLVSKPTVTAQPESVTAYVNSTVQFTVKEKGAESYQWQYRTSSTGTWYKSTLSGNKTATLTVKATAARSGYQYRCKLSNSAGSIWSAAAVLTVSEKPVITVQPKSISEKQGETVSFTVQADGAESYQWYYRKSSSGSWAKTSLPGNKTASISAEVTEARSGNQYRCKISNAKGSVYSNTVTLRMAVKPKVTTQPLSYTASVGAWLYPKVKATGAESYQWYYRTSSSGSWRKTTLSGAKTATLTVKATSARNGYQYCCKLSSAVGTCWTRAITLTVSDKVCGEKLTWKLSSDGAMIIAGTGGMDGFDLFTQPWEAQRDKIKTLSVKDGVTSIGESAFEQCGALTEVKLADSVTEIGTSAFGACQALREVLFPANLKSIGNLAFSGCGALPNVTLPDCLQSIGTFAFSGCSSLYEIMFPEDLSELGDYAFCNCEGLQSVIPNGSLKAIGGHVFEGCSALKHVAVGFNIQSLGQYAFANCSALESVSLPASLTTIASGCFTGCPLQTVYYFGTPEQWYKINIASGNEPIYNAEVIAYG